MLQLPVIALLLISTFVGRASPVLAKDENEKVKAELVAQLTNANKDSTNTSSKVVEPATKPTVGKKENVSEGNISTSTKGPSTVDVVTPISIQKSTKSITQNCTSTKEPEDMLNCNVTPADDDDAIEKNTSVNSTESNTTAAVNNKVEATTETKVETEAPNISPQKDKENGQTNVVVVVNNSTEATDKVSYDVVVPLETDRPQNVTKSDIANTKHDTDTKASEVPTVPTPPLLVDKAAASVETEDVAQAVKSTDQSDSKRMPSGIIALVTAISFAVAIALVYIGMIVWRRYIEYRYGHRELLVNELEFDTNDLRHFEL